MERAVDASAARLPVVIHSDSVIPEVSKKPHANGVEHNASVSTKRSGRAALAGSMLRERPHNRCSKEKKKKAMGRSGWREDSVLLVGVAYLNAHPREIKDVGVPSTSVRIK